MGVSLAAVTGTDRCSVLGTLGAEFTYGGITVRDTLKPQTAVCCNGSHVTLARIFRLNSDKDAKVRTDRGTGCDNPRSEDLNRSCTLHSGLRPRWEDSSAAGTRRRNICSCMALELCHHHI